MGINEVIALYSNGGCVYFGKVSQEHQKMIMGYYDAIHDAIKPWLDSEGHEARIIRAGKVFPDLNGASVSALVATIEFDYR